MIQRMLAIWSLVPLPFLNPSWTSEINHRSINNLRYADDTNFMEESEEELKSLLMKVKEEHEKAGLKLNIQKKQNKTQHS